jgi:hypothetical protein
VSVPIPGNALDPETPLQRRWNYRSQFFVGAARRSALSRQKGTREQREHKSKSVTSNIGRACIYRT